MMTEYWLSSKLEFANGGCRRPKPELELVDRERGIDNVDVLVCILPGVTYPGGAGDTLPDPGCEWEYDGQLAPNGESSVSLSYE